MYEMYHAGARGPRLTVHLPASTPMTLTLRTRQPSYATPFSTDQAGLGEPRSVPSE
jgi:hypothetical protein